MSFKTDLISQSNTVRSSIGGIFALKEYLSTLSGKLSALGEAQPTDTFSMGLILDPTINPNVTTVCTVAMSKILDGIEGIKDYIDVQVERGGSTVRVTWDLFYEQFQNFLNELQLQREFINTCLSNAATTAEAFMSSILAKYSTMPANLVEGMAQYLAGGDKLSALQGWFQSIRFGTVSVADDRIQLVKREDYEGVSVWSIVLADFVETVESSFDKLWRGIQDLKGFFERLWKGVLKLGQYILRKAIRPLASNFEAADCITGILDYPLFQTPIATWNKNTGVVNPATNHGADLLLSDICNDIDPSTGLLLDGFSIDAGYIRSTVQGYSIYSLLRLNLKQFLERTMIEQDANGAWIARPIDIAWNNQEFNERSNLVFRFGEIDGTIYLQVYHMLSANDINVLTDADIIKECSQSVNNFFYYMRSKWYSPLICKSGNYYPAINNLYYPYMVALNPFVNVNAVDITSDGALNLSACVNYLDDDDLENETGDLIYRARTAAWYVYAAIIPYCAMFGPMADNTETFSSSDVYMSDMMSETTLMDPSFYSNDGQLSKLVIPGTWCNEFRPYLRGQLTPSSVHFQSTSDRATELERYIIIAIIAAAAVYLTVKMVKFKRNMSAKSALARGAADSYAWDHGTDLSPENIAKWKQLNKTAKTYEFINQALGFGSRFALNNVTTSLMESSALNGAKISSSGTTSVTADVRKALGTSSTATPSTNSSISAQISNLEHLIKG